MSNEIEMYVQDKEGTKNEIHFIINDVICWGKRCSLNTVEQLKNAGFEIYIPEDRDCKGCDECDKDLIKDYKKTQEDIEEVDPKFQESIKNDVALNEEIPENKEEEDEEYDEDKEIEAQKQAEYLSSQEENN